MSAAGKRFRVTVPLGDISSQAGTKTRSGPEQVPLTLATADIVRVTGFPGELEEAAISGATVARLLEAAGPDPFNYEIMARELEGIARMVGHLVGVDDDEAGPYALQLALESIARRVEAMRKGFVADVYQVRAAEAAR